MSRVHTLEGCIPSTRLISSCAITGQDGRAARDVLEVSLAAGRGGERVRERPD